MTTTYIGSLSIGATMPAVFEALFAANADLEARIAAYANFGLTIQPPSLQADLEVALEIVAALKLNIAIGIVPPSIELQFELLLAALLVLKLQLEIIFNLMSQMSAAGLHVYHYAGTVAGMGAELSSLLASGFPGGGSGSDACNAMILATSVGATWLALSQILKVTP